MTIHVQPMPRSYLKISEIYRPGHPPIFDGTATPDEIKEANALLDALDPESQRWYRHTPADLPAAKGQHHEPK